jgi:hypothetical protein
VSRTQRPEGRQPERETGDKDNVTIRSSRDKRVEWQVPAIDIGVDISLILLGFDSDCWSHIRRHVRYYCSSCSYRVVPAAAVSNVYYICPASYFLNVATPHQVTPVAFSDGLSRAQQTRNNPPEGLTRVPASTEPYSSRFFTCDSRSSGVLTNS